MPLTDPARRMSLSWFQIPPNWCPRLNTIEVKNVYMVTCEDWSIREHLNHSAWEERTEIYVHGWRGDMWKSELLNNTSIELELCWTEYPGMWSEMNLCLTHRSRNGLFHHLFSVLHTTIFLQPLQCEVPPTFLVSLWHLLHSVSVIGYTARLMLMRGCSFSKMQSESHVPLKQVEPAFGQQEKYEQKTKAHAYFN